MYKRTIVTIFIFFVVFLSSYIFAQDNQKYRDFINFYVEQIKTLKSYNIEYIKVNKISSSFNSEEISYIDSLLNSDNFKKMKPVFEGPISKNLNIKEIENVDFIYYFLQGKDRQNRKYTKVFSFSKGKKAEACEYFLTDEKVTYQHGLGYPPICSIPPTTTWWRIDNNPNGFSYYFDSPLDKLISWARVGSDEEGIKNLYLDEYLKNAASFSYNKQNNNVTISVKNPNVFPGAEEVILNLDESINCITGIKIIRIISYPNLITEVKLFDFQEFGGIKIPKKIESISYNDKQEIIGESIYIFGLIEINSDHEIKNIGQNDIKDGEFVYDYRVNYNYKKGYPED